VWLEARDIAASRTNVHASPAATVALKRRSKAHALNCSTAAIEWDAARAAFLWHLCHREPLQARSRANRVPAKSSMGRRRSDRGQRVRRRRLTIQTGLAEQVWTGGGRPRRGIPKCSRHPFATQHRPNRLYLSLADFELITAHQACVRGTSGCCDGDHIHSHGGTEVPNEFTQLKIAGEEP
jgi:hypothetical protein